MTTDNNIDPFYVPTLPTPELAEHVSDINIIFTKAAEHLNQYASAIQSLFIDLKEGKADDLMRVFDDFNFENLTTNEDMGFVEQSLRNANYPAQALNGETVILFSQPVIVSEIFCRSNSASIPIRLISSENVDKAFKSEARVTKTYGGSTQYNYQIAYKIHDVVLGFVLPSSSSFDHVYVATSAWMIQNQNALETANDAINKVITIPNILNDKLDNINSIINSKIGTKNSLTKEVDVLKKNHEHEKKRLENLNISLEKAEKDFNESHRDYKKLSENITEATAKLSGLEQEIRDKTESYRIEKNTYNDLMSDTQKAREALKVVEQELADANRQKNLTTLDMVGHANETSKQLIPYYILAFLIFVALACITTYIYQKGENFIDTLPSLIDVSSWDILLSRLPLMTATALIIGGLSGVFFFLVKHIVFLNTEKMTMLKAAILAEQITNSIGCENMSPQEQLEFKRDTKIKLITQTFSKGEPEIDKARFVMDVLKAISDKK
ncbi:hypothetical protein [Vibrio anguillarum]|uniref:hypothetical protein n=1 Tax=Vibrio anguillarum TaxID=55601 RepID=UPI001F2FADA7|nr:hypothetical protein [Vibrio anguillarum]